MTPAGLLLLAAAGAVASGPGSVGGDATAPAAHGRGPAPAAHSIAWVNDPLSHGTVGDNLLSLNEAIQLYNRTLQVTQLSLGELNQLGGFGADIAWASLDASATPTIVVERDFDLIQDLVHGLLIDSFNGETVIDFATNNVRNGFQSVSNYNNFSDLVIRGGDFGIDLIQTDAWLSAAGGTLVDNVTFENQAQFGFRLTGASAAGGSNVITSRCRFVNCPSAIVLDDTGPDRVSRLLVFDTAISGGAVGIDCSLGDGGSATLQFARLNIDATGIGLAIRRPGGATRPATVLSTFVTAHADPALQIEGTSGVATTLQLRTARLSGRNGGTALALGAAGAPTIGFVQDSTTTGDVDIGTGGGASALLVQNLRASNGTVTLTGDATQAIIVQECRFDACATTAAGTGSITFDDCCVAGGSLDEAAGATLSVSGSYSSGAMGAGVAVAGALPAEQLGSMSMTTTDPLLGGSLTLQCDLPAGLFGIFAIGAPSDPAFEYSSTIRAYVDLGYLATVPGLFRAQQGAVVPVPMNYALLDTVWNTQLVVLPDPGMQAPPIQTPPGDRFVIR